MFHSYSNKDHHQKYNYFFLKLKRSQARKKKERASLNGNKRNITKTSKLVTKIWVNRTVMKLSVIITNHNFTSNCKFLFINIV